MTLRRVGFLVAILACLVPFGPAAAQAPDAVVDPPPASAPDSLTLPGGAAHAWQAGALRPDRLQHASLSFGIGCGVGIASGSAGVGAGTAFAFGIAKELLDDHVDPGDLVADAIGAALAALAISALTRGGGR